MVHSCFSACKPSVYSEEDAKAFTVDERPPCGQNSDKHSILCLSPYLNEQNCEIYQPVTQHCLDSEFQICYDWFVILYSLIITNILGLTFETAFAYSFEISLKPTSIEMMENPNYSEEMFEDNPETIVPGCGIVI